mgnify:CR=1 FL=1
MEQEPQQQPNGEASKGGPCWEKKPPECPVRIPLFLQAGSLGNRRVQIGVVQGSHDCARALLTGFVLDQTEPHYAFEVGHACGMSCFEDAAQVAVAQYGQHIRRAIQAAGEQAAREQAASEQDKQEDSSDAADGDSPE